MNNKSLWSIVGQGAIGSMCAANLQQSEHPYEIISRSPGSPPITFISEQQKIILQSGQCLNEIKSIARLLIPTKAYDVIPALQTLIPKLAKGADVVLCHNGLGTVENAKKLLPPDANLFVCTTSNGAFRRNNNVTLAGLGQTIWAQVSGKDSLSNSDFEYLFQRAEKSTSIEHILWQKLLVNCAINPLTAIYRVKNGELSEDKFAPFIHQIVEEFVAVANALNFDFSFERALEKVQKVIELTAENTSSMLQDVIAKRPTEIDYINGFLVSQANTLGISVKTNQQLLRQVKTL